MFEVVEILCNKDKIRHWVSREKNTAYFCYIQKIHKKKAVHYLFKKNFDRNMNYKACAF